MIQEEHLKLFINEELFLLPGDSTSQAKEPVIPAEVEDVPEAAAEIEPEIISHPFIIITDPLNSEEAELIKKILSAVSIKYDGVHHIVGQPKAGLEFQKLIVFGNFEVTGVGNDLYNVERTTQMSLRADAVSKIATDRAVKTRLWNALKTWFDL